MRLIWTAIKACIYKLVFGIRRRWLVVILLVVLLLLGYCRSVSAEEIPVYPSGTISTTYVQYADDLTVGKDGYYWFGRVGDSNTNTMYDYYYTDVKPEIVGGVLVMGDCTRIRWAQVSSGYNSTYQITSAAVTDVRIPLSTGIMYSNCVDYLPDLEGVTQDAQLYLTGIILVFMFVLCLFSVFR